MTGPAKEWTIGRLLQSATEFIAKSWPESPRLDAEILLAHRLGCKRIDLYVMYDQPVGDVDRAGLRELVKQRAQGCPVAYLVGTKEFFSLEFEVGPAVLVPRPETEHIVVAALEFAKQKPVLHFIDIGVGSGAIAVNLAKRWPTATGIAVDLSADALSLARKNAQTHAVVEQLSFVESNLFDSVHAEARFDLVVSNPPYVTSSEMATLSPTVRNFEPKLALDGGADGLNVIRRLISQSHERLRENGRLVFEIGAGQQPAVIALLSPEHWKVRPTVKDFAGIPRVIVADKRNAE